MVEEALFGVPNAAVSKSTESRLGATQLVVLEEVQLRAPNAAMMAEGKVMWLRAPQSKMVEDGRDRTVEEVLEPQAMTTVDDHVLYNTRKIAQRMIQAPVVAAMGRY